MSKHNIFKGLTMLCAFLALASSRAFAQDSSDRSTTLVFKFVSGKDMFYVPWKDNEKKLDSLILFLNENEQTIIKEKCPVFVDGYCRKSSHGKQAMSIARTRSNRVKSAIISRTNLVESNFITSNHTDEGEKVIVKVILPRQDASQTVVPDTQPDITLQREQDTTEPQVMETETAETPAEKAETSEPEVIAPEDIEQEAVEAESPRKEFRPIALRANLLRWATLTPDLGIEWRISPSVGILVDGTYTSWSWKNMERRYALWEVSPEVRWYLGRQKNGYLGAMFKAGAFNYKLSPTGKQGDIMGGGITGGYRLDINKSLSFDFSLSLGCLHCDYENYVIYEGKRVRTAATAKNWWGPTSLGVTLVYNL